MRDLIRFSRGDLKVMLLQTGYDPSLYEYLSRDTNVDDNWVVCEKKMPLTECLAHANIFLGFCE